MARPLPGAKVVRRASPNANSLLHQRVYLW
jgi:hypothetical protein